MLAYTYIHHDTDKQVPAMILKDTTQSSWIFYGSNQSETAPMDENYALFMDCFIHMPFYSYGGLVLVHQGLKPEKIDDDEFDLSFNLLS